MISLSFSNRRRSFNPIALLIGYLFSAGSTFAQEFTTQAPTTPPLPPTCEAHFPDSNSADRIACDVYLRSYHDNIVKIPYTDSSPSVIFNSVQHTLFIFDALDDQQRPARYTLPIAGIAHSGSTSIVSNLSGISSTSPDDQRPSLLANHATSSNRIFSFNGDGQYELADIILDSDDQENIYTLIHAQDVGRLSLSNVKVIKPFSAVSDSRLQSALFLTCDAQRESQSLMLNNVEIDMLNSSSPPRQHLTKSAVSIYPVLRLTVEH